MTLKHAFGSFSASFALVLLIAAANSSAALAMPNLTYYESGGTNQVPATVAIGTNISVSIPVVNFGNGNTGAFSVRYFLSTDLNPTYSLGDSRFSSGLSAGFFGQANYSGVCPDLPPGLYNLIFNIDYYDEIFESNENDNYFYYETTQIQIVAPNLTLKLNDGIVFPATATTGATMTVNSTVLNTGDGPAGPFSVRYYLAPDPTNGPFTLLGTVPLNGLANKAFIAAPFTGTCPFVATGTYYLVWDIDATGQVTEIDETDNSWQSNGTCAVVSTGGGGSPNLTVDYSVDVTLPDKAAVGATITIDTGVLNTGGAAGPFVVTYYLTPYPFVSPPSFLAVGDALVDGIAANGMASATFIGPCPNVAPGTYNLIWVIDSLSEVDESDENDNTGSSADQITVRVAPSDLALSKNVIAEGNAIGEAIGAFTSTDPNGDSTFTYSLDAGTGDTDNGSFTISGNKLKAGKVFDFVAQSEYAIRVKGTNEDGLSVSREFTIFIQPVPNSGASDVKNISDGDAVVNPIDALTLTVASSNGGVITLNLGIDPAGRELTALTTFEDVNGHTAVSRGFSPTHKYTTAGVYVADAVVIQEPGGEVVAHGRKTLTIGDSEVGTVSQLTLAARDFVRAGNATSTDVATRSIKGKFIFVFGGKKSDAVQFSGTFKLPPGYDPAQANTFSMGIGNIVIDSHIDKRGKAIPDNSQLHGKNAPAVKTMKVTTKLKKGKVATGVEDATVTASLSLKGLLSAGFDTEGISTRSTDLDSKNTAPRSIQISMNLSGAPYETLAPVLFAVSRDSSVGTISGRR